MVRRRCPGQRAGIDRALPLRAGQCRWRFGRRAAAPGRRDRLRLHAQYPLQPDRRLQDHPQLHHHAGERDRRRLHGVGGLQARALAVPAGRGRPCVPPCAARSPRPAPSGQRVERDLVLGGRDYRLLVHTMAPTLGRRYQIAAAVPIVELSADSQVLLERAALAAAAAVGLAVVGALLAALLLSRSLSRIAGKTERIRSLDFSDQRAGREPHHRDRAAVELGRAHARGAGGVRPLRVEEPRSPDHALARDRGRRRRRAARSR